jgi:hypothetical protein
VPRVPLLSGSSLVVVDAPDDAVVIGPPPPSGEPLADVGAAVRDALEELARRGGRAAIVAEPPALPLPGADVDPRQAALAAVSDELERTGIPSERQTIVVAGGLTRRAARRELETLVSSEFALRFRGEVHVHDVEDPELVQLGESDGIPLRVARPIAEADTVVVVSAAQTVLHGGPGALLAACNAEPLRVAAADSLLETHGAPGWELALAVERLLQRRVATIGVSLTLEHPRLTGALLGYPYEPEAFERIARSPLARVFRLLPAPLRMRALRALPLELPVAAVFGGPPSVAHTEALLRGIRTGSAYLSEPLDAICVGVPRATPYLPRERPNPLLAAYLALGFALRLWRDEFPLRPGGSVVLVNAFRRRFAHPTQGPYRPVFRGASEEEVRANPRPFEDYRAGRTVHPLLPFVHRDALRPVLDRVSTVFVAGCRDAVAARQLGFVPAHGVPAALEMIRGMSDGKARVGFLLSPPYFPLQVGGAG